MVVVAAFCGVFVLEGCKSDSCEDKSYPITIEGWYSLCDDYVVKVKEYSEYCPEGHRCKELQAGFENKELRFEGRVTCTPAQQEILAKKKQRVTELIDLCFSKANFG